MHFVECLKRPEEHNRRFIENVVLVLYTHDFSL